MFDLNKSIEWIKSIAADPKHGYSQYHRYGPDYDCSSLITTALRIGGADIPYNLTTYDMKNYLEKIGYKSIGINEIRQPGDIFLSVKHHVVMSVSRLNIVHASIDENGTIVGRKQGDQTGREICERSFYTPSYGWDYHFRYIGESQDNKESDGIDMVLKILSKGMKNIPEIKTLQILLKAKGYKGSNNKVLDIDGSFGANTDFAVRNFQKKNTDNGEALEVDGIVGYHTWNSLLKGS